ncbi:MAG: hypothetical protein HY608_03395 [Planctomycetes bacterium]|nr:hypothetical protein [Planctomycetota bacterium]
MRELSDERLVREFMRRLGARVAAPGRVYLTGGATAVLHGWRASTVDVDIAVEAERDAVLREIPALKEELGINVELASPSDFLPELPGWRDRCLFIVREGRLDFFHYDPYAQALAKIERGHARDNEDVREILARGLVRPVELLRLHEAIESQLYLYPAVHPSSLRRALRETLGMSS